MCHLCKRRGFLGAAAALSSLVLAPRAFAAGGPTTSVTPDEALARLRAGNAKFVQGPDLCVAELARQRDRVAKGQLPWATVLACADSRVAPELLFGGVGPGELFVARNAGNMADTATMGSIEYGAAVLGVPLVLVLGHSSCGAVAAACEVVQKGARFPGSIGPMVDAIVPAARAVSGRPGDMVDLAVRESALRTARQVATASPIVADLVAKGKVKVVAARYGLDDGRVEFLA
jgi:carbonic anhydrase